MYRFAFFVLAGIAGAVAAQGAAKPDPASPSLAGPTLEYRSVFADYRPYTDEKLAPWRDVNDNVSGIGGHAGVTGQRKPPAITPGAAAEAAKPRAKAPAGHGGHR